MRCSPGQWTCAPRAPGSQELPAAWGAALLGVPRASRSHVGAMAELRTRHRSWQRLLGLTLRAGSDALGLTAARGGGAHQPCTPWEGSDPLAQPQALSSLLPASTETPSGAASQPPGPTQPWVAAPNCTYSQAFDSPHRRAGIGASRVPPSLAVYSRDARASRGEEAQPRAADLAPQPGCKPLLLPHSPPICPPATSPWPHR